MRAQQSRLLPSPLWGGSASIERSEMRDGVGVFAIGFGGICDIHRHYPHPAHLRLASVSDPPHKGEGKKVDYLILSRMLT